MRDLIDSVADLTDLRDKDDLERALAATISDFRRHKPNRIVLEACCREVCRAIN